MQMQESLTFVATAFIAIIGWFIVNWLNARRDANNKRWEMLIFFLIEAYRKLANSEARPFEPGSSIVYEVESAVEDIQLFAVRRK